MLNVSAWLYSFSVKEWISFYLFFLKNILVHIWLYQKLLAMWMRTKRFSQRYDEWKVCFCICETCDRTFYTMKKLKIKLPSDKSCSVCLYLILCGVRIGLCQALYRIKVVVSAKNEKKKIIFVFLIKWKHFQTLCMQAKGDLRRVSHFWWCALQILTKLFFFKFLFSKQNLWIFLFYSCINFNWIHPLHLFFFLI